MKSTIRMIRDKNLAKAKAKANKKNEKYIKKCDKNLDEAIFRFKRELLKAIAEGSCSFIYRIPFEFITGSKKGYENFKQTILKEVETIQVENLELKTHVQSEEMEKYYYKIEIRVMINDIKEV